MQVHSQRLPFVSHSAFPIKFQDRCKNNKNCRKYENILVKTNK